ncbi:MAG: phosphoenolpyruvate--protein phosphotransferase [Robiginitomaculum sp.]|nr:MAG: phosphoenolpyruvate--protein phosphotransferase [Robiginitomaculum sp.]
MSSIHQHVGHRKLLRQIRETMAGEGSAQSRLDGLVEAIASNLRAEVCSLYLRRPDASMELWATHGLAPTAVHVTTLEAGEGLVGETVRHARPLNLPDAPSHAEFSFHPETMEDPFHSFLGVPVLRGGRLLGVLVVQNREARHYSDDDVEALQNVSMVLAEIVSSGDLLSKRELEKVALRPIRAEVLSGLRISDGLAVGRAVLYAPGRVQGDIIADDPEAEKQRLSTAIADLRRAVDALYQGKGNRLGGPSREVLEAYRMFANDQGWLDRLCEAAGSGLSAEAAVERVRGEHRARLLSAKDPYLRERLHDLEDLANQLLRHLGAIEDLDELPEDTVLIARVMGPAGLLELDRSRLKALVLEEGSPTSHAAIVARALRLPVVGHVTGLLDRLSAGDTVLVDGEQGIVSIRPDVGTEEEFRERVSDRRQRRVAYARLRDKPALTRDGKRITLSMNAGLRVDLPQLEESGAEGIGLFRTEFQFLLSDHLPRQREQMQLYRDVLEAAGDRPVVFRTIDLGGDKVLPYVAHERESNPALGWRAMRMALDRPGLLRYQLRALIEATAGRELNIMFPLITTLEEFCEARALLAAEIKRMERFGKAVPSSVRVGSMVETPAIVWQLESLLKVADFVSVGANDLMQYFFAADRENPRVASRYDILNPGSLRMLGHIASLCKAAGRPASVCGEIAGQCAEAAVLIALGFTELSVPPAAIGPVKRMILSLDQKSLGIKLAEWLESGNENGMDQIAGESQGSVREKLLAYAQANNLPL